MGNCLKAQLKETVNNKSLEKFNVLRIPITLADLVEESNVSITFLAQPEPTDCYDNNGVLLTSITIPSGSLRLELNSSTLPNNVAYVEIHDKNLIDSIRVVLINKHLFKSSDMKFVNTLSSLTTGSAKVFDSKDTLNELLYNKSINTLGVDGDNISGNIKDIAKVQTLNTINIRFTNNIEGTIEDFAEELLSNYVADRTVTMNAANRKFKESNVNGVITFAVTSSSVVLSGVVTGTWDGTSWS